MNIHAISGPPVTVRLAGILVGLLPLVLFFSGMAMTPFLIFVALLLVGSSDNSYKTLIQADRLSRLALISGMFLVWPCLSIFWSIGPSTSAEAAAQTVGIAAAGVAGLLAVRPALLAPRTAGIFTISMLTVAALVLLEKLPHGGLLHLRYPSPVDYEKFMVVHINRGIDASTVLVWPLVLAARRLKPRWPALMLPLIVAIPVAVMHSLSAKVSLAIGIASYLLVRKWPHPHVKWLPYAVPILLAAWPLVFATGYQPFFTNPAIYERLPDSAQARVDIWNFVLEHIRERPLLGWGMESSRIIPGGDVPYFGGLRTHLPLHPHNSVLQILLEQGIIGLALSLGGTALIFRALFAYGPRDNELLATGAAASLAYLAVGFTAFGMWQTWWIAVAWITALIWRAAANMRPT